MSTRHNKVHFLNTSITTLTTSNGSKADTPIYFYKDNMLLRFFVNDNNGTGIDLTAATFEFKIAESYNTTPFLTVSNSDFILADWVDSNITLGKICCRVDMNQAAISTYLNATQQKNAQAALWMTLGGINYCLVSFPFILKNIII